MSLDNTLFSPAPTRTVPISATNTGSVNAQFAASNAANPSANVPQFQKVRITNTGSKVAYVKLGTSSAVTAAVPSSFASPGDFPIVGGLWADLDVGQNTWCAAICGGSDTTTLEITPGF